MRTLSPRSRRERRGVTLVEALVSASIAAVLFGAVGTAVIRSNAVYQQSESQAQVSNTAQRALERIARELTGASRGALTLSPSAPLAASSVQFRRAEDWSGGALTLGPLRRVRFEADPNDPPDGLDNDRDGSVDEGRIVLATDVVSPSGIEVVLAEHVREYLEGETPNGLDDNGNGVADEPGFCAILDPVSGALRLCLSIERRTPDGRTVISAAQTVVRFRND